ncbi:glycosyltransferase family 2 protein, partial [Candidatus Woesearchaeota archaeon]|nr:glycosyltransferase family 2 protein [Candidatus Woesearchaeota archaeon]
MVHVSVVIPNYNSTKTIGKTIRSLQRQTYKDFDATIVDDKSKDHSVKLIKRLIKGDRRFRLVELKTNRGAGNARNQGVKSSKGDIILFTDSDVIIKRDTVEKAVNNLKKNPEADAVVGFLDRKSVFPNLPSVHFNSRIHYNYMQLPRQIDILYTSICAVRRKAFNSVNGFDTSLRSEEDPDLGYRLAGTGHKIILDKTMTVYHFKHMSLYGLLRNDYFRALGRFKLMVSKKLAKNAASGKMASTPKMHIYSALLIPPLWLSIIGTIIFPPLGIITLGILAALFAMYYRYLKLTVSLKGFPAGGILMYLLIIIDMTVVNIGLFSGLLKYVAGTL